MDFLHNYIYYIGAFGLIFIGIFIMISKRNYIKVIIGLSILDTGVNLFLISVGYISSMVTIKPKSIRKILLFLESTGTVEKVETSSGDFWRLVK